MKYNLNKPVHAFIHTIDSRERFMNIDNRILPGVYPYYMISNFGRVYHKYTNSFLKPGLSTGGYQFVYLSTEDGPKLFQIHRLVMIAFNPIPNYSQFQVNHLDGVKSHNDEYNLEWTTRRENIIHAYKTGLHPRNSNLSNDQVIQICDLLLQNKYTNQEIADMFDVKVNVVSDIKKKKNFKDLTKDYNFNQRPGRLFKEEDIFKLCEYFQSNPKDNNITINDYCRASLSNCGFDNSDRYVETVRKLYSRKYYTNISNNFMY